MAICISPSVACLSAGSLAYAIWTERRLRAITARLAALNDDITLTNQDIDGVSDHLGTVARHLATLCRQMDRLDLRSQLTARRVFADRVERPA